MIKIKDTLKFFDDIFYVLSPLFMLFVLFYALLSNYNGEILITITLVLILILCNSSLSYRLFYTKEAR